MFGGQEQGTRVGTALRPCAQALETGGIGQETTGTSMGAHTALPKKIRASSLMCNVIF